MATNWTDATLFTSGEVVLPKILSGLTTDADIYFYARVKQTMEIEINYRWHDYPDFDIEEITAAALVLLKQPALYLNLAYICEDEIVNGNEDDSYLRLYEHNMMLYKERMGKVVHLLTFDEPDGINDTLINSIPIKR